jgi:hypothetical protein
MDAQEIENFQPEVGMTKASSWKSSYEKTALTFH